MRSVATIFSLQIEEFEALRKRLGELAEQPEGPNSSMQPTGQQRPAAD